MSEYIPKYPSKEGDDSNKTSSELLAETLKPNYVPQELMLAWESHLASYSRDTNVLLDQVKESEDALNTQYQALLARVQKYEQMLQDITMDSNEFTMDTDEVNFTGWNILAQASYWDYLLKKEITKLSDKIKGIGTRGELVSDITNETLEGLVADNNYISNVIEALSNTPLIQELDAVLNSTSSRLSDLQAEYVRLAEKQVADAEALANQLVENAEQSAASLEAAKAEQLDRLAEEAAANANATQAVNAEVARVNGKVVSTATSVNNLSSNVGLLRGSINEVRQTVTNNQESTNTLVISLKSGMADANDVSMMMRNAAVVFEDLSFKNGWNGVQVYNNYRNGALVANFTNKLPDNPVASTRQIEFIHSGGATTPELGGFCQYIQSRANGVFLVKFVAKLPIGFSFGLAANAYGDGANGYFIGGSEGTGKFKTYYAVYRCGATGYFSTVGFVYVRGSHPTPENPLIWYLASSTMYDCLDSKVAPDSVVNGMAEAKSTASTAVNKAEATAVMAQNLQAALDNTNANISTNYYTKAEADTVVAGKVEEFSSSVLTSNENLFKGNILHVPKIHAPGISSFNYSDYWVINANSGNGGWITLDLGVSSQAMNINGLYEGPVTVSMNYMMESGNPEALPAMYFGHGYQPFVHSKKGPHVLYKWYRIYTTFYTDANTLLSSPHLGVGGIAGRICIRNLKIERGNMTIYSVDVRETTNSINGIEAVKTVTIDNNGVMSGYGLISQLKNGQVTSAFGVNADTFYIGAPASNKKPFLVTSYPQAIDGITYPAGTWINSAIIANATIGSAHIKDAAITTAKIGDLQVDTLKIKDNAISIGIGAQGVHTLSTVSNGGKIRLDVGVQAYNSLRYPEVYLRVLRNGTVIRVFEFGGVSTNDADGRLTNVYSIVCALPPIIETIPAGTTVTYSIQVGFHDNNNHYRTPNETVQSWVRLRKLSMAITELKK